MVRVTTSRSLSGILTCLLHFLFTVVVLAGHGAGQTCAESFCGSHGPNIRFPFRIRDRQPERCGYPGFEVSCTEGNRTVVELPNAVKLFVQRIDYKSQVMYVSDPQGCLPRQRLDFDLYASHFQPDQETSKRSYALFNCSSSQKSKWESIDCLSSPTHKVYSLGSDESIFDIELLSCTKMHDIVSVPEDMLKSDNYALHLTWNNPKCGSCEAKGHRCRYRNYSSGLDIECYHNNTDPASGKPGNGRKLWIIGIVFGFPVLVIVLIWAYRFYRLDKIAREYAVKIERFLDDYRAMKPTRYSYADLKRITNHFKYKLGQGTYGTVFKGKLSEEILVAVKVLNNSKGNGEEFVNEVGTMGSIHHVNVVRLVGFCAEGFRRALVYEYLPNDSLQKFIPRVDGKNQFLGWEKLHGIAIGIARGIEYLHQGCDQMILHFDIKPQNILLDNDFNPKISDFGLAKLCSKDKSAVSMTTARGTVGYIAPEVFSRNFGNVSYKADVYSFGMLLLEMIGGRKNVDDNAGNGEEIYFPEWIYNILEEGEEDLQIQIEEEADANTAKKLAIVGLWCIQWNPADRPPMKSVVQMLEGDGENLTKPPNPFGSSATKNMNANVPRKPLHVELPTISEAD